MEIARKIIDTLKKRSDVLATAGFEFCLIGGLAVDMVGKPRAIEDIDFFHFLTQKIKNYFDCKYKSDYYIVVVRSFIPCL